VSDNEITVLVDGSGNRIEIEKGVDLPIIVDGNEQVRCSLRQCHDRFQKFLKSLIEIATLQSKFMTLYEVIQVTDRRVNALEFVIIPSIDFTVNYIEKELDEESREDFFRLKRVTESKKAKKPVDALHAQQGADAEAREASQGGEIHEDHEEIFESENDGIVFLAESSAS
jgi:hypothetical protein